jgi:hypothetical protein
MIKKFNSFNEAKLAQGDLLEDVTNAFAYLVDENPNIKITKPKSDQVSVFIPAIISPSRKYTIEEYADVHNTWNEIVQDTWVAAQQLTNKGDISVDTYTIVGSQGDTMLRLTFFSTANTDVFKINAKTIFVSKVNLLRDCKFPSCDVKITNHSLFRGHINVSVFNFEFEQQQSIDEKTELLDNLRYVTNKYGLSFTTGTIGTGFYLSIYFKIPVANSVTTGANKKFILKDLV